MNILYNTDCDLSYIAINPIRVKYLDPVDSVYLFSRIYDNLSTQAKVYYELRGTDNNIYMSGNLFIDGDNYITWTGDSDYVFNYLLTNLSLTEYIE